MTPIDKKAEVFNFEKESFQSVIESALYTCDNMFGDIRHAAEQELLRRLALIVPEPAWSKKHTLARQQAQIEAKVKVCINEHKGFVHGCYVGFCPQCMEELKVVIGGPSSRQDSLNAASSLLDVIQKFCQTMITAVNKGPNGTP